MRACKVNFYVPLSGSIHFSCLQCCSLFISELVSFPGSCRAMKEIANIHKPTHMLFVHLQLFPSIHSKISSFLSHAVFWQHFSISTTANDLIDKMSNFHSKFSGQMCTGHMDAAVGFFFCSPITNLFHWYETEWKHVQWIQRWSKSMRVAERDTMRKEIKRRTKKAYLFFDFRFIEAIYLSK